MVFLVGILHVLVFFFFKFNLREEVQRKQHDLENVKLEAVKRS